MSNLGSSISEENILLISCDQSVDPLSATTPVNPFAKSWVSYSSIPVYKFFTILKE